jgi:PAS domain S-box-containing protein
MFSIRIHRLLILVIPLVVAAIIFTLHFTGKKPSSQVLSKEEQRWLDQKNEIVFISQTDYPPFEFIDREGRRQGMCLELVSWIATEFGFRTRFTDASFQQAQEAVLSGEADVLTSLFYSKKRDRRFDFTRVMWKIPATIFVRSDRPDILSLEDLRNKRIAIQKGDYARDFLYRNGIPYVDIPCENFYEAVQLVIQGEADAVIGDRQIILHHLYSHDITGEIKSVGDPLYIGKNCMGTKEDNRILVSILNKGIIHARERGVFHSINHKWIGTTYIDSATWFEKNLKDIIIVSSGLFALVLFVILWNIQLRYQVRQSTARLSETNRKYQTIFDSANDALIVHDIDGAIIDVNDTMVSMYGLESKEEARTLSLLDDISTEKPEPEKWEHIWERISAGEKVDFEWKARRPHDNSSFDVWVNLTSIYYGDRHYILATVRDITESKATEQQLIQSQKMETLGTLSGGLAHDFNNVLAGITGSLSLLKRKLARGEFSPDVVETCLQTIEHSTERAKNIVSHLLSLSRKEELNFELVNLNHSIKQIINIAKNSFDKSVTIEFTSDEKAPLVRADITRLEQVILNICINAEHAMTIMRGPDEPRGGILEIHVERMAYNSGLLKLNPSMKEEDHHVISIRDTGVGIPEANRNKIFNPFFSTKEKGGSGLGLSMVYNIIQRHDGFINVSSSPGEGTTFEIYLPVAEEQKETAHEKREKKDEPESFTHESRKTILLVDDEPVLREIGRSILHECGYEVVLAKNGKEAVDLYRNRHDTIDLVLLDMLMPEMNGKDAYLEMKKIDPGIRAILSSGFRMDERVEEVMKLGVQRFVQKPYTLEKLCATIQEVLEV